MTFESVFFGPLSKDNCNFFYIVMVLYAVFAVFLLVGSPMMLMSRERMRIKVSMIMLVAGAFMTYFVMRLQYNMCINVVP